MPAPLAETPASWSTFDTVSADPLDLGGQDPAGKSGTYQAGRNDPLHLWYPYLEAFSPILVEAALRRFTSGALRVLDPFSGIGTTALTGAMLGHEVYYAEINPLLQLLTEAKLDCLCSSRKARSNAAAALDRLAGDLRGLLDSAQPAQDIRTSYFDVFGDATFFDEQTFDLVLRTRGLLDEIESRNSLVGRLANIAAATALVPASLLIRAGDLRYRSAAELERRVPYDEGFADNLALIASDLARLPGCEVIRPELLAMDAKTLGASPSVEADVILTSPPYLNGTNYFRNTKIELWALRFLQTQSQLAWFRSKTVTAGINDVSRRRQLDQPDEAVRGLVATLRQRAYDNRIPLMVQGYFQDLKQVFSGGLSHLKPGGKLLIDIGDSVYSGVHVQTPELVVQLLESLGAEYQDEILVRKRWSHGGRQLKQSLLVLKKRSANICNFAHQVEVRSRWSEAWQDFKSSLPHQKPPFSKRNWGHPWHSLCSYQGKMKPALASMLVGSFVPKKGRVLDPFAGVATIPFEAACAGMTAYGFDLSPAAFTIAKAKLERPDPNRCASTIAALSRYLDQQPRFEDWLDAENFGFNGRLTDYFHPGTLREILLARRFFMESPPSNSSEALVLASLLHILHGNRPYALSRRSHPITPFAPTGPFEYRSLLSRLEQKVDRTLQAVLPEDFTSGTMYFQDAAGQWPAAVDNLDAIITSPPFFDSTRFHTANWMRIWFCGWSATDFALKPQAFLDERQKTGFEAYKTIFRQSRERLKTNGVLVLHLGKSSKCDMADRLTQIARTWFRVEDQFTEDVAHCESHGIRDKGTVTGHQFLGLA